MAWQKYLRWPVGLVVCLTLAGCGQATVAVNQKEVEAENPFRIISVEQTNHHVKVAVNGQNLTGKAKQAALKTKATQNRNVYNGDQLLKSQAVGDQRFDVNLAKQSARTYLKMAPSSKAAILGTLVNVNHFTKMAATAALDALKPDWNQRAYWLAQNTQMRIAYQQPSVHANQNQEIKLVTQKLAQMQFTQAQAKQAVGQLYRQTKG